MPDPIDWQTRALAAAERAFCDAALSFADAKASIEDQAADYKRALAALQAARGGIMTKADIIANTLDGLRNTNDTLRASLATAEKALEVARRERDEANELLRQATKSLAECINDREAALAQAAGLREALTQVSRLAGNWQTQDQIYDIIRVALATPGPTIGELQAEALEELAEHNDDAISKMTSQRAFARVLRAEAARLRGGPR